MSKNQFLSHVRVNYRLEEAVVSQLDGVLFAKDYDDVYFDACDGLSETHYVFIDGNDLVKKLHKHEHLTIAETGFGTGLNFLGVLSLMDKFPNRQIDYISFESRPLPAHIIAQSHAAFPALANLSKEMLANLPPNWPGLHLRHFKQGRVRLHLHYGLAEDSLSRSNFLANIWFLDGFAPAKNPDIWSRDVLTHIGRLTHIGGSLATFTAARMVLDGLKAAGFTISKKRGFGRKRNMITGQKTGVGTAVKTALKIPKKTSPIVGIIGGGIAGSSVAAGLHHRGIEATILDAGPSLATAASGNRLALQTPRLSVDHNDASQLSASCLAYAAHCSDQALATISDRVISLDWPDREVARQDKFRRQNWPDDLLRKVDVNAAAVSAGMHLPTGGVLHDYGRVIDPARLCHYLAGNTQTIFDAEIMKMSRDGSLMILDTTDGRQFAFDAIVLATGASLPQTLKQLSITGLRVEITSGQVSHVPEQVNFAGLHAGLSYGGYLTPVHNGFHDLGATFVRGESSESDCRAFAHNRGLLPPGLRELFSHLRSCSGRVSHRASTPDRIPLMGCLGDGIYLLGAVGARGFTFAPLLGEYLAAQISTTPNCLTYRMQAALDPFRFHLKSGL